MERGGTEGVEMIMWLAMRGALGPSVKRVHRNYTAPFTTGYGLVGAGDLIPGRIQGQRCATDRRDQIGPRLPAGDEIQADEILVLQRERLESYPVRQQLAVVTKPFPA